MPHSAETRAYRLLARTIALCAALIIAVELGFFLFALNKSSTRCEDVQDIRSYILGATERGIVNTPTLSYYKQHPDELEKALTTLREQRDIFREPLDCSLF